MLLKAYVIPKDSHNFCFSQKKQTSYSSGQIDKKLHWGLEGISDFGLTKWLPNKWTHHAVIPIVGTFGYLAPEYFMHGIVDEKTDVFAFGVLLLAIITGRRPVENLLLW
ncbi:hypothetical protein ACSBR2_022273 [Camellia fascicularis]